MNLQTINRASGAAVGLLLVSVIFAGLTLALKLTLQAPSMTADRDTLRSQALADLTVAEATGLSQPAWVDPAHGVVRLPIETALKLAAQQGSNPAVARAELIARQEKASMELPKTPEKPSAFE